MTRKSAQTKLNLEASITIRAAIDAKPLSRKSIHDLAPEIHIGRNQLQTAFKHITGTTVKHYRLQKRMEAARDILITGVTVKQVASKCGYKRQSNFTRDYKNVFGMTPMEWLRTHYEVPQSGMNGQWSIVNGESTQAAASEDKSAIGNRQSSMVNPEP
jgi:AraC-like DNA-binding protein